jgi:hypothetical protein
VACTFAMAFLPSTLGGRMQSSISKSRSAASSLPPQTIPLIGRKMHV